ncbi:amidase [Falsiroseomonas oryziterrae]|uniref:amidase n=1 Tax=Falsiroseomonas oryziterrae TaxID=2911368 RepID=UPI001F427A1A|nr:amidase [Roseomonas sp. NPKOSM-4]
MSATLQDPATLTASEAAEAIAAGRLSAEALVRACLDRIVARDAAVQAWAFLDPDLALAQARAADRSARRGPLHGVPVGLKDIIDTYDMPTQCNSPIWAGRRPYADSACAAAIRAAGGVILGKTVTTEFANRHPGPTRHPMDPERTPGGSSSGSAAAVADHQVPLAIGTQTSGSMIRPAAFCGIWGYKPSFGEISRVGVFQQSGSLDTLGFCARSLEDVQRLRAVMLRLPYQPVSAAPTAPRIALCRTPQWNQASAAAQSALEDAARRLAAAGARVTELELPPALFGDWLSVHRRIANFESARNFGHERHRHRDMLSKDLGEGRIRDGEATPLEAYVAAQRSAEAMRAWAEDALSGLDAVLTLPAAGEAPKGLSETGNATFNSLWTMLYTPCLTLPFGSGPGGMPLGVQLVSQRHEDERLFATAGWVANTLRE